MMQQVFPLRRIFSRFFPRKYTALLGETSSFSLPVGEKQSQALHYLHLGEAALLQGNLSALSLFEMAASLDPENPIIWHRQGLAFFEYGSLDGKEKSLLLASKNFKIATSLNPSFFEAWVSWGIVLLKLGRFHEEHHYFLEAREKYQKAIELAPGQSRENLAELYWDYGLVWSEIAEHSGEAIDVRLAIQSFNKSLTQGSRPSPEFWHDMGSAYVQMGLLINDSRFYLQSIDYLSRSVAAEARYVDGWMSMGYAFSQLYINTMDERFAIRGAECFSKTTKLEPYNADAWLSWGQLLGESGRLNKDIKQLSSSIEKCSRAHALDLTNPTIISQWVESLSFLGALSGRLDLLIEAENKILKWMDACVDDPDLWRSYGICLIAFGKYYEDPDYLEIAIEKLQYGLSLDRTDAELWHALGTAHKIIADITNDIDMIERASRFFLRAIDLKPSCPALIYDAACALLHYSEVEDSLPSLEQAIALFEVLLHNQREVLLHHPEWLYQYGCALEWMGDFSADEAYFLRANEIYSQVLLIDPDYPNIHFRIGVCQVHLGHMTLDRDYYSRAIQSFRLTIRQDEENEKGWLEWGLCLVHLAHQTLDEETITQLYFEAEEKILRAGSLGDATAHYHLAGLYSILGRYSDAMDLIHQSLNLKALPSIDEMLEDEWLENLRSTKEFAQFLTALEAKFQPREE
jgi:tetratricopeptide (TPR) repeat protein